MRAKFLNYYKARNARERVMIWCVVAAVAAVWTSSVLSNYSRVKKEDSELSGKLNAAKVAISMGPEIHAELDSILKTFDPKKTLSAVALQIAAEECARKADLTYSLSGTAAKSAGRFKINTITLSCQKGALKNLAAFEEYLREKEPYVMISRASLEGGNTGDVSAKYEISSFEFER